MTSPPLRELQLRLREIFARPPGSEAELARAVEHLPIRAHGALSAAERVRVYADMYFVRLRDALAEDHGALRLALGGERFAALARAYVDAHPSDRPSLRDLGRHLSAFLERRPELVDHPWQRDLAAFEWAMVEAFDAPDDEVLDAAALESLPPAAWPELHVRPVGSLVLLGPCAPADTLRERLLAGDDVGEVALEPVLLRVWRQDLTVFHRRVDALEHGALAMLRPGASFAALCAWLAERVGDEGAGPAAVRLLRRWLDDALLVRPDARLPSEGPAGT
jgi:hypothetical protein